MSPQPLRFQQQKLLHGSISQSPCPKKYFHAEVSQQARNWPPRKTPLELWSMFIYPSVSGGPSEHARLDDLSASHFFARTSSGSEQYFIPFCPSSEPFDGNFSSVSRAGNPTYNWFYFQFCIKQKLHVVCKKYRGLLLRKATLLDWSECSVCPHFENSTITLGLFFSTINNSIVPFTTPKVFVANSNPPQF